jgi:hypothetical protein
MLLTNLCYAQIRDWFSKIDSARAIAQRPPPSYMRLGEEQDAGSGLATDDIPSLDEMQRYNSAELALPEVPAPDQAALAQPPRAYNWSALQEGAQPRL